MSFRYIGNKSRLSPWLLDLVGELVEPGARVADPMCGTASLSFALRQAGFQVIAGDITTFATFHAATRLLLSEAPPFEEMGGSYGAALEELDQLEGVQGYFFRELCPDGSPESGDEPRRYFTTENASKIDAIIELLNQTRDSGTLSWTENALLRHDLILAANRVANIVGTYGHFWSKWNQSSMSHIELRASEFDTVARTDHVVVQGPVEERASSIAVDLCYLDPPYTKRQYAANYHVLETLARGDAPPAAGVSGLRPWRDQYSDFCSKVRLRDSFSAVFERMDCPLFLISYSEDGLISADDMLAFLSGHGEVEIRRISFPRFRSNQSQLARKLDEYAFILRKESASTRTPKATGELLRS